MVMILPASEYDEQEYDKDPVQSKAHQFGVPVYNATLGTSTVIMYGYEKYFLESDDRLWSLGFMPLQKEFFKFKSIYERTLHIDHGFLYQLHIGLELDAVNKTRQIYTIWDVLGDVGGLMDMLRLIGLPIIALIKVCFGNSLNRLMLHKLFMI